MKRIILFILIVFVASCAKRKVDHTPEIVKEVVATNEPIKPKAEDFAHFYSRFHNDSVFQLNRLDFPLQGEKVNYDNTEKWTPENWMVIKTKIRDIDTTQFNIIVQETDSVVSEQVEFKYETGYHFSCTYKLIKGKWFLVKCNDINL